MIPISNVQETKELEYFQKIQIQKQEITALKIEIGKQNAEIQHLTHTLKEKITEELISRYGYLVNRKNCKMKYCKCLNELMLLKNKDL